jgi:hypothetical protein
VALESEGPNRQAAEFVGLAHPGTDVPAMTAPTPWRLRHAPACLLYACRACRHATHARAALIDGTGVCLHVIIAISLLNADEHKDARSTCGRCTRQLVQRSSTTA